RDPLVTGVQTCALPICHRRRAPQWGRLVAEIADCSRALDGVTDAMLRRSASELGERLRREGFRGELITRVFALVREAADRTIGRSEERRVGQAWSGVGW